MDKLKERIEDVICAFIDDSDKCPMEKGNPENISCDDCINNTIKMLFNS